MTQRKIASPVATPPIVSSRLKGRGASDYKEVKQKESFNIKQEFIAFYMPTVSFSRAGGGKASNQMDGQLKLSRNKRRFRRLPPAPRFVSTA